MKKKFYSICSLLLSSLITMMGFGACKTSSKVAVDQTQKNGNEETPPFPTDDNRVIEPIKKPEPIRVVYGPPPTQYARIVEEVPDTTRIMDVCDEMPVFPGGQSALVQWLCDNLKYPDEAKKNGIKGRVVVVFVVEKDGSVGSAKVFRSVHPILDAEALRVVNAMPKWTPGKMQGKPVRVKYTLPLTFKF